ncbi:hypothetical protein, partial [Streptomyces microflavus]|uniref:hypothetical protein n=1 Tax=Streptomyces microflavus TaxID=1919 RepID=UPI0033F96F8A
FTTSNLARYDAVAFLSTTGDVLNAEQQKAFELPGGGPARHGGIGLPDGARWRSGTAARPAR